MGEVGAFGLRAVRQGHHTQVFYFRRRPLSNLLFHEYLDRVLKPVAQRRFDVVKQRE